MARTKLDRLETAAKRMPNYPGRKKLEAVVRPMIEPWAQRASSAVVQRLLGYWMMWASYPGGRREIVDLGLMSRAAAYNAEADFRRVFGIPVEDFDPSMLQRFFHGTDDEAGS
jgi:hypothetical protein